MQVFKCFKNYQNLIKIILFILIAIGVPIFFQCSMSDFGSWLTGLGTISLFLLAYSNIPSELINYRARKYIDAQMEAAICLMQSSVKIINAIEYITSPVSFSGEVTDEDIKNAGGNKESALFKNRYLIVDKEFKRFYNAKDKARVFLSKEIYELADDVSKEWNKISIDIHMLKNLDKTNYSKYRERLSDLDGVRRERMIKLIDNIKKHVENLSLGI